MQANQILRVARMATRGRNGIVSMLVVGLVMVGTWWFSERGNDAEEPDTRPSQSAPADPDSGLPSIAVSDLPPEAHETLERIDAGGPFPFPEHDDQTFGNFEGILPDQPDGYYREYTVETPGLDHRGALRIVTGDEGEFYWTDDHYESFSVIRR